MKADRCAPDSTPQARSFFCRNIAPVSLVLSLILLAGCGSVPQTPAPIPAEQSFRDEPLASTAGRDVAMYALMLLQTGYSFGGKNPEAGLDCSGMVTYVYREAAGVHLTGNAASLAREGRQIKLSELRAGDLVFFNTLGRAFSHVGIYLGRDQFIHAPNSRGRVRVDKLSNRYYASRFETARSLLD
jgi:cell wall-associated NlpC family hydrolase